MMPLILATPRQNRAERRGVGSDVRDYLMWTALELTLQGRKQFTLEELAVNAWRRNLNYFGMKGYLYEYPDFNRVRSYFYGKRGLLRLRLFVDATSARGDKIKLTLRGFREARQARQRITLDKGDLS